MKLKAVCSVFVTSAIVFLAGCGGSSPSDIAKKWCAAIAAGKLEDANKVSHGDGTFFMNGMAIAAYKSRGKADSAIDTKKMLDCGNAEVVGEKIDNGVATVELRDKAGIKDSVRLVKINGEWKVKFK